MAKDSHPVLCEHYLLGNAYCARCEHCHLPYEKRDTKLFAQLGAELAVAVIVPCFWMGLPGGIQLEPQCGRSLEATPSLEELHFLLSWGNGCSPVLFAGPGL